MAKNLLQYSDYPIIEIANRLSFSSQSHFIQQFREVTGMTPGKYRDEHYIPEKLLQDKNEIILTL